MHLSGVFVIFGAILASFVDLSAGNPQNREENACDSASFYSDAPYQRCEFTCTPSGVDFNCGVEVKSGCQCHFDFFFNTETQKCERIECKNMDCVGRKNEAFFNCESGSRNGCGCGKFVTLDCNTGCMCKNGFCKKDGVCVPRECTGSPFDL